MLKENGIEKLKELNIKEISSETRISVKSLEHIIKKDFDELHMTKTLGFIKILEKNYDLDLSDWLDEFKSYKVENPPREYHVLNVREERKSKLPMVFFVILVIACIGYFIYPVDVVKDDSVDESSKIISEIKGNIEDAKKLEQEPKGIITEGTPINNLEDTPKDGIDNILNQDINGSVGEANTTYYPPTPVPQIEQETPKRDFKLVAKVDTNATTDTNTTNDKVQKNEELASLQPLKTMELYSNKIIINAKDKTWIGILNLKTNTKKQVTLTQENKELELKDGYLFATGHSAFTIVNEGISYEFKDVNPAYFYYEDGVLNKISKEKFKKLSKDTTW